MPDSTNLTQMKTGCERLLPSVSYRSSGSYFSLGFSFVLWYLVLWMALPFNPQREIFWKQRAWQCQNSPVLNARVCCFREQCQQKTFFLSSFRSPLEQLAFVLLVFVFLIVAFAIKFHPITDFVLVISLMKPVSCVPNSTHRTKCCHLPVASFGI